MFHTSAAQARAAGRMERRFWGWEDYSYEIMEASGFSTSNDGYWWVPDLGFSGKEGIHLFDSKEEAKQAALRKVNAEIARLEGSRENILLS